MRLLSNLIAQRHFTRSTRCEAPASEQLTTNSLAGASHLVFCMLSRKSGAALLRNREENIVLVLSKAVLVLEPDWEARSVIINIHGLMFLLNAMVPFEHEYEYEYEYEYEQYHYGTVKFCQSSGKAGGFLGKIMCAFS